MSTQPLLSLDPDYEIYDSTNSGQVGKTKLLTFCVFVGSLFIMLIYSSQCCEERKAILNLKETHLNKAGKNKKSPSLRANFRAEVP